MKDLAPQFTQPFTQLADLAAARLGGKVVACNDMGESIFASPAVSRGQMLLRTVKHLYCIGTK